MSFEIDLNKIKYNPTLIQSKILNSIEENSDGNITFTDPTNPFLMLMEANIDLTNSALQESISNLRKNYSSLAIRPADLYHHLSDIEMVNVFAIPAEATMLFTVNLNDLIDNGYEEEDKYIMSIPEYSTITVSNTKFTTLNDIKITYYKSSKKAYIEQMISDDDLSIKDLGVLRNDIIKDNNDNEWIVFETMIKQLERFTVEDNIIKGMGFQKEVEFADQYHYSIVYIKNPNTGNEWMKINTTHSDIVFDPEKPTVHVKVMDNHVLYTVPELYLLNNTISGLIRIVVYSSKGELTLNINKFPMDDFSLLLGNTAKNNYTAVTPNIVTLTSSNHVVDGGRNQRTMEELRSIIINNTTGKNEAPITSNELKEYASYNGFYIDKVLDVITDRYFIATKNIPEPINKKIKSKMDVFINKTEFVLSDYLMNDYVNIVDSTTAVIRSGATFINENNKVRMLSNAKYEYLKNLNNEPLVLELLNNKYFYTPFYYITSIIDGITTSRVFDFDVPKLDNLRILSKINGDISVNIDKFTTYSTNKGFTIIFTVLGNELFSKIPTDNVKAQLSIKMSNTEDRVYFYATMERVTGYLKFEIDTNFFVNDDNELMLLNGNKELIVANIDLETDLEVILYTNSETVNRTKYGVTDEIVYDLDVNRMALSKETVSVTFGKELKYLWNSVNTDYTDRKYKLYDTDIPMRYTEDIYDMDIEDGSFFDAVDTDGDGVCDKLEYKLIHEKGDIVKDSEGNELYIHRKGDPVLDDKGNPVIDGVSGIVRYIDILMLEHEYRLDTSVLYSDYKETINDLLRLYIDKYMNDLNEKMLDNTTVFYSPSRSNSNAVLTVGAKKYVTNQFVSPVVTLYVSENSPINNDKLSYLKSIVGIIIHGHLDNGVVNINDIKEDIKKSFGTSLKGVKLTNLDGGHDFEMFNIENNTSRLTIKKKIMYDVKKEINIEYDIDLRIYTV